MPSKWESFFIRYIIVSRHKSKHATTTTTKSSFVRDRVLFPLYEPIGWQSSDDDDVCLCVCVFVVDVVVDFVVGSDRKCSHPQQMSTLSQHHWLKLSCKLLGGSLIGGKERMGEKD